MECIKCKAPVPDGALYCPICGRKQEAARRKYAKRANGTGNISRLPGARKKPWMARKNGICIGTYSTRAEAQKALERLTDVAVTDKFNMTFAQIYAAWLPDHGRTISKAQKACYASAYRNCPELHQYQFRQLRRSDFQAVIIRLEAEGKSKSTCEKMLQLFGQLSSWAIEEGITQVNHAKSVTISAKQFSERVPFLDADIAAIQRSSHRAAGITLILLACGCRPNELFSVPLINCHDDYFIGGSKTDAGRNRIIMISQVGLDAYQALYRAATKMQCHKLIDAYDGNRTPSNFAKRDFSELMEEIGCKGMTPYNCRHTFITNAIRSGVPLPVLQKMVGHVDKNTTQGYTHLDVADLRSAAQKITVKNAVCNKSVTTSQAPEKQSLKSS